MRRGPAFSTRARSLAAAVVCVAVLTGVAAATAFAASPSPSATGLAEPVFRVGFSYDIDGMNPLVDYSGLSWEIFRLNYNFLTWYDENNRPVPELATKWQISPDGKVWTFTIRDDVTWHDGVPLTAKDIAFTYNLILDNQIYFYMSYVKDITKVEAPDDATLVITSKRPNPLMLGLYIPILPEHLWGTIPGNKVETVKDPPTVGSGPFAIDEVKKGSFVKMTANPDYFAGRPTINTLLFEIYTTEDALVQDYKNGTLDIGVFQVPTSLRSIAGVPGSKTIAAPDRRFHHARVQLLDLTGEQGQPPAAGRAHPPGGRRGLDKARIAETSMSGAAKEGTSVLSPAMGDWHWEPQADQLVTYDPENAKAILEAAGYTDRDGDGVREDAKGKKLDFKLVGLSDYPDEVNAAKMLIPYLKSVGIKARLEVMDEGAFGDILYGNDGVDMYVWAWGGDLDPSYQLSAFTTDQILNNNDSCYSNPEYDKLFEAQSSTVDRAARVAIVQQMQQILYNDDPYVLLYYGTNLQAYRADRWTGWQLAPVGTPCGGHELPCAAPTSA